MSLFSTITHDETPHVKGFSRKGFETSLVVLALLMFFAAVVYVISSSETATEEAASSAVVSSAADSHFLEINTTGFVDATPVSVIAVDPFMEANVASMEDLDLALKARQVRDPSFAAMNVASYEILESILEERRVRDAPFAELNIDSYDWLNGLFADPMPHQPNGPQ